MFEVDYWCLRVPTGVWAGLLVYVGAYWCLWVSKCAYWCLRLPTGVCGCLLVSVGADW